MFGIVYTSEAPKEFSQQKKLRKIHISGHIVLSNMDMGTSVQCSLVSQI